MRSLIKPLVRPNFRSTIKGANEIAINYVARLDGVSQYWGTQVFRSVGNEDWLVKIVGTFSNSGFFVTSTRTSDTSRLLVTSSGAVFINNVNAGSISSVMGTITNGSFHSVTFEKIGAVMRVIVDGSTYTLTGDISNQEITVNSIGSQWGTATGVPFFSGVIKDVLISIGGNIVLNASLTDKDAGAIQQASVGSALTMINYTPDVWEVAP